MTSKTIRIWDGATVVALLSVSPTGSTFSGAAGGAHTSLRVDIELDPWAGLIVDHSTDNPPVGYRQADE